MPIIEVRPALPAELERCLAVRREVFVVEQGVPEELEVDGEDPRALHVLALDGEAPVGAARLRLLDARAAKVERVCVAAARRGEGLGARLMAAIEGLAQLSARPELVLASQRAAVPFYLRIGYRAVGEPFMEAGIEHLQMRRTLAIAPLPDRPAPAERRPCRGA